MNDRKIVKDVNREKAEFTDHPFVGDLYHVDLYQQGLGEKGGDLYQLIRDVKKGGIGNKIRIFAQFFGNEDTLSTGDNR